MPDRTGAKGGIVILTGAGISAESGLSTFRDEDGIWARHAIEDVATPEAFARDPAKVQQFYNARRKSAADVRPNAAHEALARLESAWPGEVAIVTQNVDGLHEAAGSRRILHMHGELSKALCPGCRHRWPAPGDMATNEPCPACSRPGARPDVVWFGEMPYHMDEIAELLSHAATFAAIGTSGEVYPAAGFARQAAVEGAHTVELNLAPSSISGDFAETRLGPATRVVPAWVDSLLSES